jgi:UDP-GlcNAc:undecaprenyl-phosphate GlcNAc-1-phosphate transferase
MSPVMDTALALAVALLVGWAVPAIAMKMLVPSLEASAPKVRNYRGVEVPTGLGIAWLTWSIACLTSAVLLPGLQADTNGFSALMAYGTLPAIMILPVFALGLIDDAFGGSSERGFRGHLRALARGRLTTGGLKMIGIGLVAIIASRPLMTEQAVSGDAKGIALWLAAWALKVLVIALSANLVNLTDLRPGRALKTYVVLMAIALPVVAADPLGMVALDPQVALAPFATRALLFLGPVVAVWRYDLGERAMLGDAGANVMGALAGYVLASALPLWGLAIAAAALIGLNLLSEKVSFTRVIEANAALRWIDGLGRMKGPAAEGREHSDEGASPPDAEVGERDSSTGKDGAN